MKAIWCALMHRGWHRLMCETYRRKFMQCACCGRGWQE